MSASLPVPAAKDTESAGTMALPPRFTVVLPLMTSWAPAGAALSPSAMRTSPVSWLALPRMGMLRMKLSVATAGETSAKKRRVPRTEVVRFMTSFPRRDCPSIRRELSSIFEGAGVVSPDRHPSDIQLIADATESLLCDDGQRAGGLSHADR